MAWKFFSMTYKQRIIQDHTLSQKQGRFLETLREEVPQREHLPTIPGTNVSFAGITGKFPL
jgi:hypothetical protein